MMRLWPILLVAAGCSAPVARCKSQTLFVRVTLDSESQTADQLVVDVAVDGGAPITTSLPHAPGRGMGGLEIDFARYPEGRTVSVVLTAVAGGARIGSGEASQVLGPSCDVLAVGVTASPRLDLSAPDAGPGDLQISDGADLALSDGALATGDLSRGPPDLIDCISAGAEDCFNGTDDDCDGLADCADPDCTGGANPPAMCVPDPGSFALGTQVAGVAACPSPYPSPTAISSGFVDSSCSNGSCTCPNGAVTGECTASLHNYGSADSLCGCGGGTCSNVQIYSSDGCKALSTFANGVYHLPNPPQWLATGLCSPTGGTPQKTGPSFAATDTFCARATAGGGCDAGKVCVPQAANHCVLGAGSQTSCPANYVLHTTRYFTGLSDDKICSCTCAVVRGSCDPSSWLLFDGPGCTGGSITPTGSCSNSDLSTYVSTSVGGEASSGSCGPTTAFSGSSAPSGEQTLCCTL